MAAVAAALEESAEFAVGSRLTRDMRLLVARTDHPEYRQSWETEVSIPMPDNLSHLARPGNQQPRQEHLRGRMYARTCS